MKKRLFYVLLSILVIGSVSMDVHLQSATTPIEPNDFYFYFCLKSANDSYHSYKVNWCDKQFGGNPWAWADCMKDANNRLNNDVYNCNEAYGGRGRDN